MTPPPDECPLLIRFRPGSVLHREQNRVSSLPIVGNGPPGTFVLFPGLKVSLPTDQVVFADDCGGSAEVGFGGMQFAGIRDEALTFHRVRELFPEAALSPARSHVMRLEPRLVAAVCVNGRQVWPAV
jgi:hypothetical protein